MKPKFILLHKTNSLIFFNNGSVNKITFMCMITKGMIMKKISKLRFLQFQECLSPLGKISSRPLFGGYSLAIENTVFAMVAEGEIYLRVCEQSAEYRVEHHSPMLIMRKNGRPVALKYYRIDEALWQDSKMLFHLSELSLHTARSEKQHQRNSGRLKDLPNISFHMELMLIHAGITDVKMLRTLGAEMSWLKLREHNKGISINVLESLAGAIAGIHSAALPAQRRQELREWANTQGYGVEDYSG
ncbi:TfoX/Sxy family DNA transformation protein [Klebsiella aerogenes]|nr:TfoX/Sxy family DNA transformation protein [Klebsiella aerogenes]TSI52890.1 TfoX/Sxy family DNA transformation protein [Klebsiella aerogenes]TSI73295.1 TfoX/Sxy family DNA transformation protein [Klebsiella aerogenes]TSI89074.1 TfoX/Sxy family DNA transformation protein [Klebsiella aerogenes]TSI93060.1 TfoX/Sxy family DNA transformation protein [Klebsiella aerogenes]